MRQAEITCNAADIEAVQPRHIGSISHSALHAIRDGVQQGVEVDTDGVSIAVSLFFSRIRAT